MKRRRFLTLLLLAGGLYLAGRVTYFALWERYDLRVSQWDVPLPNLPGDLDGLRIALLSDLHIGRDMPRAYIKRALRLSGELEADAIVLDGDVLAGEPEQLEPYRDILAQMDAPKGKYAILGNHDFLEGRAEPVTRFLREAGWTVLRNESTPLPGTDGRVWLIGVEDMSTGAADLEKALDGVPKDVVRILLAHQPDYIDVAAAVGVDLMLAGHTHGGQFVLPFVGPLVVPSKYSSRYAWGLFDRDGTRLFVTRGVGMNRPMVRFNCPPEIAVLVLRRGDAELSAGGPERDFRPQIRRLRQELKRLRKPLSGH